MAFSVLIIGYFFTIYLMDSTRESIEYRLENVRNTFMPMDRLSSSAEINFDNLIKSYSDAVLMGEPRLIQEASEQYNNIMESLERIREYDSIPDQIIHDTENLILLITDFNHQAEITYNELAYGNMDGDILASSRKLSEKTENISLLLQNLTGMLSGMLEDELQTISREMEDIQFINRIIFYAVLLISLSICIFVIKIILLKPMKSILYSSDQVAKGNLKLEIPVHTNDELGDLSDRFNYMTAQLFATVSAIHNSYKQMIKSNIELENSVDNVVETIERQGINLKNMSDYLSDIISSIKEISDSIKILFKNAEDTSSSVIKMSDSVSTVLKSIEVLDNITIKTAESSEKLASNIKLTSKNANQLNKFAENISSSMFEMEQSTKQIEIISKDSMRLSEEVSDYSKESIDIVEKNIKLMNLIRDTVFETENDIEGLKMDSAEIGNILIVINDITEQTNLLSLNAAIIAAHAGEHGKGFSVVAEEIRDLSERTKKSTREIEGLIKKFQNGLSSSVSSMQKTSELVDQGARHSQETGNALKRIYNSAEKSSNIAKEIVRNTREQTESQKLVAKDVHDETAMIKEMNQVLEELAIISEEYSRAVEGIKNSARESKASMKEQATESRQISEAINNVTDMIDSINIASQEQKDKSSEIRKIADILMQGMEDNIKSIQLMTEALSGLKKESVILKKAIAKFKIDQ